jgi:hypothetical protein
MAAGPQVRALARRRLVALGGEVLAGGGRPGLANVDAGHRRQWGRLAPITGICRAVLRERRRGAGPSSPEPAQAGPGGEPFTVSVGLGHRRPRALLQQDFRLLRIFARLGWLEPSAASPMARASSIWAQAAGRSPRARSTRCCRILAGAGAAEGPCDRWRSTEGPWRRRLLRRRGPLHPTSAVTRAGR